MRFRKLCFNIGMAAIISSVVFPTIALSSCGETKPEEIPTIKYKQNINSLNLNEADYLSRQELQRRLSHQLVQEVGSITLADLNLSSDSEFYYDLAASLSFNLTNNSNFILKDWILLSNFKLQIDNKPLLNVSNITYVINSNESNNITLQLTTDSETINIKSYMYEHASII